MPRDVIPQNDDDFDTMFEAFAPWIAANGAAKGLTAAQLAAIAAAKTDWDTKFPAHEAAQQAANIATYQKNVSREAAEPLIREAARRITDQGERAAAGLNVYAERRGSVPAPTTRPILMVDTSQRFVHTIKFADETTPNSRAKPDGAHHIEIWWCISPTPPTGHENCNFLATDTNTPYLNSIDSEHAGKMVHYMARWVSTRNEFGPWSETVSATVTG